MKSILFIVSLLLICLVSCNNLTDSIFSSQETSTEVISLSEDEFISIMNDNVSELSESDIIDLVREYQMAEDNANTRSLSEECKVVNKYYISSDTETGSITRTYDNKSVLSIPIYEVSINAGKGLSYVSGDSRHSEVIAYIPQRSDSENDIARERRELMLSISENSVLERIEKIELAKKTVRLQTLKKISEHFSIPIENLDINTIKDLITLKYTELARAAAVSYPDGNRLACIGPWLRVTWGQLQPYNSKLDMVPGMEGWEGANIVAGCYNVVAATVLSKFEPIMNCYGTNIDWTYLKERERIINSFSYQYVGEDPKFKIKDDIKKCNMVGELFKFIYYGTKSFTIFDPNAMIDFGKTGTYDSNLISFLRKYIACDDIEHGLNTEAIYNSIKAGNISIMAGQSKGKDNGHGWVVDGCNIHQKTTKSNISTTRADLVRLYNVYFHCNMGWDGQDDGYYLVNSDMSMTFETYSSPGNPIYNSNFRAINNIKRK